MAHQSQRLIDRIRSRPGRTLLVVLAVLIVILVWLKACKPAKPKGPAPVEQSLTVSKAPYVVSTGFLGEIAPGDSIAVIAPFDGLVKRLAFSYGDHVELGQVLAELDASDVKRARNEAEGGYLKAAQAAADMQEWATGPEMSRARRSLTSATLDLRQAERQLQDTKMLLDRGLVPRTEYENLEQQLRSRQMALETAEQELQLTARRGQGASRRIATLDLENASERLRSVSADIAGSSILAPDAGIIFLPPVAGQSGPDTSPRVGARLSKGQTLGVIARAGGLGVRFKLDESDVNAIKPGQAVTVTGPGFAGLTLTGRLYSIAGQATNEGGAKASFVALAHLDPLKPDQARQVRIGMSASINVESYRSASAIAVPQQAIQPSTEGAVVTVRDPGRKTLRTVKVTVGRATADRIEVLSGLKPGDTVVWTPTPSQ